MVVSRYINISAYCDAVTHIKELRRVVPIVVSSHTSKISAVHLRGTFVCSKNSHCHDRNSPPRDKMMGGFGMAVASAEPYRYANNLHFAPTVNHANTSILSLSFYRLDARLNAYPTVSKYSV